MYIQSLKVFISIFGIIFFSHTTLNAESANTYLIKLNKSEINVSFALGLEDKNLRLNQKLLVSWIQASIEAVDEYYQGFPVKKLNIAVNPNSRISRRPINGVAYHGQVPLIVITLNPKISKNGLKKDWVLVHELVHLGFPPVHRRHHWIEEGLATYVEPIARVRAGLLSEEDAWKWLIQGIPNGLPSLGDKGLDFTPTWGRTYWGGALFFLLADIEIHKQTKNQFGIEHALRAIKKAGGTMQNEFTWPIEKILQIGDKATSTNALTSLYKKMKNKPMKPNLNKIWKRLGVTLNNNQIDFDNSAPDAELRKSLIVK